MDSSAIHLNGKGTLWLFWIWYILKSLRARPKSAIRMARCFVNKIFRAAISRWMHWKGQPNLRGLIYSLIFIITRMGQLIALSSTYQLWHYSSYVITTLPEMIPLDDHFSVFWRIQLNGTCSFSVVKNTTKWNLFPRKILDYLVAWPEGKDNCNASFCIIL